VPEHARGLQRRRRLGVLLESATVAWNTLEAVVAVAAGLAARSLALVAFGLDSCVEVFASLAVLWYMRGSGEFEVPARARRALRLIGVAFAALGVYLVGDAVHGVLARTRPAQTVAGMVFMAATVVVMFTLAVAKRRVGRALGNQPLLANGAMTMLDGWLSAGVLAALLGTALAGWWWLDPLAAGVVGLVALREGWGGWRGDPAA
jgi:divalent metal cation (Fe/Co/Zn/Cd) transporter